MEKLHWTLVSIKNLIFKVGYFMVSPFTEAKNTLLFLWVLKRNAYQTRSRNIERTDPILCDVDICIFPEPHQQDQLSHCTPLQSIRIVRMGLLALWFTYSGTWEGISQTHIWLPKTSILRPNYAKDLPLPVFSNTFQLGLFTRLNSFFTVCHIWGATRTCLRFCCIVQLAMGLLPFISVWSIRCFRFLF